MTGRKRNPDKLIARTVRNRPDVDAVLVRMAKRWGMPMADLTRHACEALAGREDELNAACEEKAKREGEG